jgi:ABC-2 type transport system ATP-binding protein
MGMLAPSSGGVRVFGTKVRPGRGTMHHRIGYLPGDFRAWPNLTARRSLEVMAAIGGAGRSARQRRKDLAARLELDLDRPVEDLSKGNRQKVGVIFAFQTAPDLLILDEPTTSLDPLIRQAVWDIIRDAARGGATVLLSSHDLAEVAAVCERAAILREGRLVELSSVARIVGAGAHQLKIWFAAGAAAPAPPLDRLPDVHVLHAEGQMLHLAYHGSPDAVLRWLAGHAVERISVPRSSLEDAFVQYYSDRKTAAASAVPRQEEA